MVSKRPTYRPPSPPRPRSHRLPAHVYWRRRAIVVLTVVTFFVVTYFAATLFFAILNPTYGVTTSARAAEWGRQHGLGGVVNWAENESYRFAGPKVGGTPPAHSFGSGPTTRTFTTRNVLPPPANIDSPALDSLPGEGVWHVAGRETGNGIPTVYEAYVRPDALHTSYVVGVAWMDTNLLTAQLYSGSVIPGGGSFTSEAPVSASSSENLVAAFNAGLIVPDDNGGYYSDGTMVKPLRKGAASVVIFKNGRMTVGKWGRDVVMNNQIASVRQNLDLIVDNSEPQTGLDDPGTTTWGTVMANGDYVWRSGLGVTKDGALVYVGGPSMTLADLADVLIRAGAEEAMELEINPDWVQYSTYGGRLNTALNGTTGTSLLPSMLGSPTRYFQSYWGRDFFTMSLRANETTRTVKTSTTTTTVKKS
jgi:hypothetical protein